MGIEHGGPPEQEILSPEEKHNEFLEKLDRSEKFGKFFEDFIHEHVEGKETPEGNSLDDLGVYAGSAKTYVDAVDAGLTRQEEILQEKNYSGKDLLIMFTERYSPDKIPLINESNPQIVKLGKGIYEVELSVEEYSDIFGNSAQAMATQLTGEDSVNFIITHTHGSNDQNFHQRYLEEIIPHELHHVLWSFYEHSAGEANNNEQDPYIKESFSRYKNELLAHLCSGGSLIGYTGFHNLSEENKRRIVEEIPEQHQKVENRNLELNSILTYDDDSIESLSRLTGVGKDILTGLVFGSRNYDELSGNMIKVRDYLKSLPVTEQPRITNKEGQNGWTTL